MLTDGVPIDFWMGVGDRRTVRIYGGVLLSAVELLHQKTAISATEAEKGLHPVLHTNYLFHAEEVYDFPVLFLHNEQMMSAATWEIPCFCNGH